MRSVRIYKDDIRTHILRSLFFTDTTLVVSGSLILALLLYGLFQYALHAFNWGYYISSVFVSIIFFIAFITQRIDNQAIYKIVPRAVTFKTNKKELRYTNLEPYFVDFSIQNNLIVRKNSIIRMYEVEPFDVALLNDQDREHFFIKLKQAIHVLPTQIQFIVRKENAASKDYSKHFFSMYDSASQSREPVIEQYIEELSELINTNTFLITRHYAVISVPCQPNKSHSVIEATKRLNDIGLRFASALSLSNISVRPLRSDELIAFAKDTLR